MTETPESFPIIREAVASFPDRDHFHRAVSDLLAAGFAPSDLSVLTSHDSLAAAGEPEGGQGSILPAGLSDEIKYIGPLTVAGIVVLSGGPIAAVVAALIGAGLGGAALKELFDDYTAPRHSAGFQGGARGRRGAPLGTLRRSGSRTHRNSHPRRSGWLSRPHPRPPVSRTGQQRLNRDRLTPQRQGSPSPRFDLPRAHFSARVRKNAQRSAASGRVVAQPDQQFAEIATLQQPDKGFRRLIETVDDVLAIF